MKLYGLWIFLLLFVAGLILGSLATIAVPIGHGISGFWTALVVQVVGGIWFGGWGVLAAGLFPICSNMVVHVGLNSILGFTPANFCNAFIPAWAFRHFSVNPAIPGRKELLFYLVWGAVVPAVVGGMLSSALLVFLGEARWENYPILVVKWAVPNSLLSIVIVMPVLRELTPLWRDLGVLVSGWWVIKQSDGHRFPRHFKDMPIQLKLILSMCAAGLGPLLVLSLLELIKNGGHTSPGNLTPLFLTISLATMVLAVGFLSRQTVQPLKELQKQLESLLNSGTGELSIDRADEIGQLGRAFAVLIEDRSRSDAANLAKSTFLANMSHELRTPLNAILGFAQLMGKNEALPADTRKNLSIINRSGEHLLAMINDVLDISKIEAGKTEIKVEVFDLEQLVEDIGEMLRSRGNAKGLSISCELAKGSATLIAADLGKLRQIVINVVGNAIKFTEEGGVALRVRTIPDDTDQKHCLINIEVQDSGSGIMPDKLESIFEPFSQVGSQKDSQKGTGLGLAISRSFVHMMGGSIQVESEVGKGSRFMIMLPARLAIAAELPATIKTAGDVVGLAPGQPEWRILIVEDTTENVQLLETLLGAVGLASRAAFNGLEGVELARTWQPHFIWMDIRMPVMDGYEATRQIRQLPGGDTIKIVALTASVFKEQEDEIIACGCDAVLHKPFRQRELFGVLEQQLGIRFKYANTDMQSEKNLHVTPSNEQFALLNPEICSQLLQAAGELDKPGILQTADAIFAEHPEVATWLQQQTGLYKFDTIEKTLAAAGNTR